MENPLKITLDNATVTITYNSNQRNDVFKIEGVVEFVLIGNNRIWNDWENSNNGGCGINVGEDRTVIFSGAGTLRVWTNSRGAAIGGWGSSASGPPKNVGTIIKRGSGTVYADQVGGGDGDLSYAIGGNGGTINIYEGSFIIDNNQARKSPRIGGGNGFDVSGAGSTINVYGGSLTVVGNGKVGGGNSDFYYSGGADGGVLNVYGGKVNISSFTGGDCVYCPGGKAPDLNVYGGMVNITNWTAGNNSTAADKKGNANIYGGSVKIENPQGMKTPAQGVGGAVSQQTITLNASALPTYGATSDRAIVCGKINNVDCIMDGDGTETKYGLKDVKTSNSIVSAGNNLYLWLPTPLQNIEMNQTTNCTPLRGTRVAGGTSATLTPQSITITYRCVGVGCANSGGTVRTETVQPRCD